MGAFSANALDYATHGLAAFPVDTRAKRPLVRGWQRAGVRATAQWVEKFPEADGLGINCGPRSGITEIDVDAVGHAPLAAALESFGATPIVIQTASGKSKLWYRHNGERRRIRVPADFPVDVLGDGFTIAPPSYRTDLGESYRFVTGSLDDLGRLPTINQLALEAADTSATYAGRTASEVRPGERNQVLWHFCMVEVRRCPDLDALIDLARAFASQMCEPLGASEIERAARSAWQYQMNGLNFLGLHRPQVTRKDVIMDELKDQPAAYFLLDFLQRWHGGKTFAIAPTAMSRAGTVPWHHTRIARARDILVERGLLAVVVPPRRGAQAGRYRIAPEITDSVEDHIHPLPCREGSVTDSSKLTALGASAAVKPPPENQRNQNGGFR